MITSPSGTEVCRFCSADAAATFRVDQGCMCYPDDREQALCMQHIVRATPLGSMELLRVLDESWRQDIEARFR